VQISLDDFVVVMGIVNRLQGYLASFEAYNDKKNHRLKHLGSSSEVPEIPEETLDSDYGSEEEGEDGKADPTHQALKDLENERLIAKRDLYVNYKLRPSDQRGTDETRFESSGGKVVLINDKDCNFLPIVAINFSPLSLGTSSDPNIFNLGIGLKPSVNYFNVKIGKWEPFIEKFTFDANIL
jgi:hypothetical protein